MNDQGVKRWTQYTALWYTGDVMGLEILKTCGLFLRKSSILLHIDMFVQLLKVFQVAFVR